jgi:hypothetical protein
MPLYARPIALSMKNKGSFNPSVFWGSLNEYFKSNIICLQLFNSIDNYHYMNTHNLKFSISLQDAEAKAIDFVYNFYASLQNSFLANDYFLPNHVVNQRNGTLFEPNTLA